MWMSGSSHCFSVPYECWVKDRREVVGGELRRDHITAYLGGRAIPKLQVCLIASKRMLGFTRQVSFAQTSGRRTWVRRGGWTRSFA
jgi:hypothetical protein